MIRPEVADFTALGKLPSEDGEPDEALEEAVERAGALLGLIERPLTDEEAHALADCFGDDECFGVAWVLLHLIETAPHAREDQPEAARRWRDGLTSQSHAQATDERPSHP
ncbi:hypothetical protein [Streptomyces mirabilis]|uniref:hypothetical protein n=1 Tax=Streptomyces mirabilis TaxID=68239 RepID=UPI0036D9CC31